MTIGLETKLLEQSMREPVMFSLGKRRLRGYMVAVLKYLKGSHMKDKARLF